MPVYSYETKDTHEYFEIEQGINDNPYKHLILVTNKDDDIHDDDQQIWVENESKLQKKIKKLNKKTHLMYTIFEVERVPPKNGTLGLQFKGSGFYKTDYC